MATTKHEELLKTHFCFWTISGPSKMELLIASGYPQILIQERVWFTIEPQYVTGEEAIRHQQMGLGKGRVVILKDIHSSKINKDNFEIEATVSPERMPELQLKAYIEVNTHRRSGSVYIERRW